MQPARILSADHMHDDHLVFQGFHWARFSLKKAWSLLFRSLKRYLWQQRLCSAQSSNPSTWNCHGVVAV